MFLHRCFRGAAANSLPFAGCVGRRSYHIPVLKNDCIDYLASDNSTSLMKGLYLDCTLGGGGHTSEILRRGGKVIALDQDLDAIDKASKEYRLDVERGNLEIIHSNFANLQEAVMSSSLGKDHQYQIDGSLFDLGVSSHQIDHSSRGFAYRLDGILDMRMNSRSSMQENDTKTSEDITALQLINDLSLDELDEIFSKYGEEPMSTSIAREIVLSRPMTTTSNLKEAICSIIPPKYQIKTLSRCFQALRIAVNDEITVLERALEAVHKVMKPGGRLVVLSYHSLEDRVVKNLFREHGEAKVDKYKDLRASKSRAGRDGGVVEEEGSRPLWRPVFKKPKVPSKAEMKENSRSRSAKLRVAERI